MTPRRVVILGGGFAGLSAAVALADAGWQVTVLERRNGLGGRARSFTDPVSGDVVDNGQHVFVGCYDETLRFLKRLGTLNKIQFQETLDVAFVEPDSRPAKLHCPKLPSPWHLFAGLLGLSTLSWADKIKMGRVLSAAKSTAADRMQAFDQMTMEQWLSQHGQSARSRKAFWDPLGIAALNDLPQQTSALGWVEVLRRMFSQDSSGARLGLSRVGLSELYTAEAGHIVEQGGGAVRLNAAVMAIEGETQATGIRLASGELLTADVYLSSLPAPELFRIFPESLRRQDPLLAGINRFKSSSIISINLWLDRPILGQPFIGMIGTRVHWIFNRPGLLGQDKSRHLSLVISAADAYLEESNEQLVSSAWAEIQTCIPQSASANILRAQVVRERDATVKMPPGSDAWRPGPATAWPNLFLAGDWTRTGLPATIESAVVSGNSAARAVLSRSNKN